MFNTVKFLYNADPRGVGDYTICCDEDMTIASWSDILRGAIRKHIDKKVDWKKEGF